jgi:mono/diheme cytochrome c family protein
MRVSKSRDRTSDRTAAAATIVCVAMLAVGCQGGQAGRPDIAKEEEAAAQQARAEQTAVDRGKYLATIGGCNDCHTPMKMGAQGPEPDMSRYLSGHPEDLTIEGGPQLAPPWMWAGSTTNTAFAGPWGVSYAINLTPDKDTGLGLWSEQVFVNALKTGRHMGVGRPILPPMPWQAYSQMTDEDLKAVFAYLRSIEPRRNQAPEALVNAPPATSETPPPTP